jgi:drug/metabolite transporter (DMT)-like permease
LEKKVVLSARRIRVILSVLLLIAANLLWAGQGVAIKTLAPGDGPLAIALLPLYCATIVGLGLLLLRRNVTHKFKMAWKFHREFLLAGICGQLTAQVGMTLGVSWSTASNGAILSLLIPIFGALIAVWLLRECLSSLRVGTIVMGLAGVFILSPLHNSPITQGGRHELLGNLLITAGCLGSAFYNVYSKRLLDSFSGLETLFFSYLPATLFSLPILFFVEPNCLGRLAHLTLPQWGAFGYLTVFFYGLAMVFFLKALESVDVIIASASLYLIPIAGVALATYILKERLTPRTIIGSAIVLFATSALFVFDASREEKILRNEQFVNN